MTLAIDISAADTQRIETFAAKNNLSIQDFVMRSVWEKIESDLKAERNARYLAKIDRGIRQMQEGTGKAFTDEELEQLIHEHAV